MHTQHSMATLGLILGILGLSYAFLGWYLAAHHIIWLIGAFLMLLPIAIARREKPFLERFYLGFRGLLIVLSVILVLIGLLYLGITLSVLPSLILVPLLASILADVEMQLVGLDNRYRLLISVFLAGVGLGLGEAIDLLLLPSARL